MYNSFPWPVDSSNKIIKTIKDNAQKILDIRKEYKNSTFVHLYDPISMPPKLAKAHQNLDTAVDRAYGKKFDNDSERMKFLFELYEKEVKN